MRANRRPIAKLERKLSSTPPPKPLPTSHKTCARRSTISHARLDLVIIVFSAPLLVAQGWNVSCIGFAPAHGDACLALYATVRGV